MEYIFVTDHDQKSFTILSKVLRKTTRRARSIISHALIGTFAVMMVPGVLLTFVLTFINGESVTFGALLVGMLCVSIFVVPFAFEDALTGFLARKQMQPGTERSTAVFLAEGYTIITNAVKSEFRYDTAVYIAETKDYFVFVLGTNHAQIFSKSSISGGTVEEFRRFIEERTDKKLLQMKG